MMEYLLFPDFKKEGHALFSSADGLDLWSGPVAAFLQKLE